MAGVMAQWQSRVRTEAGKLGPGMIQSLDEGAIFVAHREEFAAVAGSAPQRSILIETNAHEGPVYVAAEHALYFTTAPERGPKNIAIKRVRLAGQGFPFEAQALET